MKSLPSSLQHLATRAGQRVAIRGIDPIGRAAYGALCVAAMAALACPLALLGGSAIAVTKLTSGGEESALMYLLGGFAVGAFCGGLFLLIFYAAYPLAADWITEWAGYVVGIAVGAVSLLLTALLLLTSVPAYVAILAPLAGAFGVGFAIAGRLAGLGAPSARPRAKARTVRRR